MIGKALRQLDYRLAIVAIVVIIGGAIVAWVYGGLKMACAVGLLLFVLLDGLSSLWTIVTRSMSERIHDQIDAEEKERFWDRTKDNPTIR
ncbi:MAG: hypothetical protein WCO77_11920 [bacterium]|jgi:hypothetical protein